MATGSTTTEKSKRKDTDAAAVKKQAKDTVGKVGEREIKRARAKIKEGEKNPIAYYFSASLTKDKRLEFVEVKQYLNDKFLGKIDQDQFFAVSEQSKKVYQLNRLLLAEANDQALMNERVRFAVKISYKWFETENYIKQIDEIIDDFGENVVLLFDAPTLVGLEQGLLSKINRYRENLHLKIILDNVESQNLSLTVAVHGDILRIDARYFNIKDEKYANLIKFYRDYCRSQGVKLAVKNVNDDKQFAFFTSYGVDILQGSAVYTPKKSVNTILRDFNID
ncbi:MAG: EAL domain-containing protein [Christensenellaceae bacterium]